MEIGRISPLDRSRVDIPERETAWYVADPVPGRVASESSMKEVLDRLDSINRALRQIADVLERLERHF